MEVDDFDEFDLDETDIVAIQIEEELYLSSQQTQVKHATQSTTDPPVKSKPVPLPDTTTQTPVFSSQVNIIKKIYPIV